LQITLILIFKFDRDSFSHFFLLIVMQSPSQLLLGWSLNAYRSVVLLISVYTYQASDLVLDH